MRGISSNTGYSAPLSPLGTNLNAPQRQIRGAFDAPPPEEVTVPVLITRGPGLTGSVTLGSETILALLQAQEMEQGVEGFAAGNIIEDEVSRFLTARKKIGKLLQSIESPGSGEKDKEGDEGPGSNRHETAVRK